MAVRATLNENGLTIPTYAEILADKVATHRSIFGADVYLEADSQEGQMLAADALALYDAYLLALSIYNAFSPTTAQHTGLSSVVKVNGIARKVATYSTVDVTLIGTAGTVVTSGAVEDVAGQKWDLPASVVIPSGGEVTVTATARESGAVQAAAGEVATIATPTRGWQSVANAQAATPGADVEQDSALRQRQQVSTALPSQTVLDGINGAVANITGVTLHKVYENDSQAVDANGQPGNSIAVVVNGGDSAAIAQAIALKKAPGVATVGTTAVEVQDKYGMPGVIRFYRSTDVAVRATVVIKPRAGYVSSTGAQIITNLVGYLDALAIGEDVLLSKLYTPINAAEPDSAKRTFDVVSLTIARDADDLATANLAMSYVERATATSETITVTLDEG